VALKKVYPIERSNLEPDLAIFFPYTWGGDYHNNRKIQEDLSLLTGALVIGAQTPGTGKLYVNRGLRRKLKPGRLQELGDEYAAEVHTFLETLGRPRRLLVGQSGRVALSASMQLSKFRPFTHVLLRDGVNLRAPERVRDGYHRLRNQPSRGQRGISTAVPDSPAEEHKTVGHKMLDKLARVHGLVEVATQGRLLCSEEPSALVTQLARDAHTPFCHVTFNNGITGSVAQQTLFNTELEQVRRLARGPNQIGAPLLTLQEPGNHADLQHVGLLATHVNITLALTPNDFR